MKPRTAAVLAALLTLLSSAAARPDSKVLHLAVGDPARSGREAPVVLDAVTDTASGELLTPAELARRLADTRIVFVGESHTSIDFHRAQLRLIEELDRAGRDVLIGLEMYPYTEQEHLDRWHDGLLTEEGFVTLSHWYRSWGYHWNYYRDIFLYARDHGITLHAVNAPREVVTHVREQGFESLSEEDRRHVPERIDLESDEHRRLFRAFFEPEDDEEEGEPDGGGGLHAGMSDEQLDSMFAAQVTWDATMGHNAVAALREHGGPEAILVVLIGSGHVAYGLGIERQVATFFDGETATVIPIPVADAGGERGDRTRTVRASYADFVWGLPPDTDELYPSLGLSTTAVSDDDPRRKVIFVPEGSVAEAAGVEVGDLLLAMDGEPLPDRETLQRRMADERWGDEATLSLERGGEPVEVTVRFRRTLPED